MFFQYGLIRKTCKLFESASSLFRLICQFIVRVQTLVGVVSVTEDACRAGESTDGGGGVLCDTKSRFNKDLFKALT